MKKPIPADAAPVARAIYARMDELKMNPTQLSREAGLNATYVRDILEGKSKNPKTAEIERLAKALGCGSVADLMAYADPSARCVATLAPDPVSTRKIPHPDHQMRKVLLLDIWDCLTERDQEVTMRVVNGLISAERAAKIG